MRKRLTALALALLSALLLAFPCVQTASAAQEDYIAASHTKSNGKPYYIMVNRAQNTVTVYGLDDEGYYTVPVKAMICSVGREGHETPLGTYSIGGRWTWVHMFDDSYGQYCTRITGNILFHSVCYTERDPSTLMTEEYNGLGAPASLGCVRLQTADAKWIYDNCARGTQVTIYDGKDSGPLGKPNRLVDRITEKQANGWDPTDPRKENPWHEILAPTEDDPTPSESTAAGAESSAEPQEELVTYAQTAQALYELSGGAGKASQPSRAVTWAVSSRLLDGIVDRGFDPYQPITRQEMAYMFYRYETHYCQRSTRNLSSLTRFSDWNSVPLYARNAMRWGVGNGLLQPYSDNTLRPGQSVSTDQLDAALQQYEQLH